MTRPVTVSALLLTLILSHQALATIHLHDWNDSSLPSYQSADGNNITTDTLTGLDWLDINTTTNISFNEMSSLLGVGELRDFRYADLPEIDMFFNNLGLPTAPLPYPTSTGDSPGGDILFANAAAHTGITFSAPGLGGVQGIYATDSLGTLSALVFVQNTDLQTEAEVNGGSPQPSVPDLGHGNWIVRATQEPVPELSSLIIWPLIGLTCIGGRYWQRRRRAVA